MSPAVRLSTIAETSLSARLVGRVLTAFAKAGHGDIVQLAETRYAPDVAVACKTLVTKGSVTAGTTADGGGPIVQNALSTAVYTVLMSSLLGQVLATMRRIPFRTPPMAETGTGASAAWISEGLPAPLTKTDFDGASYALSYKKAVATVVQSREAFRFSPVAEEANGRLTTGAIERLLVTSLLDPNATATSDRPASLTSQGVEVTTAGTSASNVLTDLENLIAALGTPMDKAAWVMRRSTFGRIAAKLASLGLTVTPTNLLGFPALTGSTAPAGQITLLDGDSFIYASDAAVEIDINAAGSVQMSDSPTSNATTLVSLFQSNLIGVRAAFGLNYSPWAFNAGSPAQASGISYALVDY